MNSITTVDFHGHQLWATKQGDDIYVALTPICNAMGIDARGQRQRIQRDPLLAEGTSVIHTPTPGGAQEMLCLRLDLLNGWLFGIDSSRIAEEKRERVLLYKRECYAALAAHFQPHTFDAPDRARHTPQDLAQNHLDQLTASESLRQAEIYLRTHGKVAARAFLEAHGPHKEWLKNHTAQYSRETDTDWRDCLTYMMKSHLHDRPVWQWLGDAIDGNTQAIHTLAEIGMKWADTQTQQGLIISNTSTGLERLMKGSIWQSPPKRSESIRMTPGCELGGRVRLMGIQSRCAMIPASIIADICPDELCWL